MIGTDPIGRWESGILYFQNSRHNDQIKQQETGNQISISIRQHRICGVLAKDGLFPEILLIGRLAQHLAHIHHGRIVGQGKDGAFFLL